MTRGISIDDLPAIYREQYLYAVEMARAQHDPCGEWEDFTDTLYDYLVRIFGLDVSSRSGRTEHDDEERGTVSSPIPYDR